MSVYNPDSREVFFAAVNSIISQSFKDWEMIMYDDGSDEKGKQLIKEAAALDPRIIYVRGEENRGLGYGINESVNHSSGKYLARMDADDISLPERFACQFAFLEENPQYHWVGCSANLINLRGIWGTWFVPEEPSKNDFLSYSPFIHPSVMFRREVLENEKYSTDNKRAEDYELFMHLYACGYKGYNMRKILFSYREEKVSYKKRSFRSLMNEVRVRHRGYKELGILTPAAYRHVLKPVVLMIIPNCILAEIKRKKRKGDYVAGQK